MTSVPPSGSPPADYKGVGAPSRPLIEWTVLSAIGAIAIALTAFRPVQVTTGWFDQKLFHWPTVRTLAGELPTPDLVNLQTATGPGYHLTAAILCLTFGLSMEMTQFATGLVTWAVLAAILVKTLSTLRPVQRNLVVVAVFASPYVIQSTFWMTTDALTLTLGVAVLAILFKGTDELTWRSTLAATVLIALAVATRQTAVWLILVGVVAVFFSTGTTPSRLGRGALIIAPSAVVLLGLIILWHGLTPPAAQNVNASGPEPIGLPVGFALWAFFAAPLLLAIRDRVNLHRRVLAGTLISAVVCAAPALCWASGYSYPDRMGGWLWKLVKAGGEVGERSPVLVALAFVGGSTIFLVLHAIHTSDQRMAWLLGTAIYTSIIVSTAASFALPKYREIPLLTCFPFLVLAVAALASHRLELRSLSAALCAPAALQLLASTAIVGVPYVQFLIDPSSAPTPEWVGH